MSLEQDWPVGEPSGDEDLCEEEIIYIKEQMNQKMKKLSNYKPTEVYTNEL